MFRDPRLVGSWPAFASHLDADGVVRRWSSGDPDLAGLGNLDSLLAAWRDRARTNAVLLCLVRRAAADGARDDDALLLLLHLLSGVVWRLVEQLGDLSADIAAVVLGEMTCQIRTYRWRTRRGCLITNLERDTRRAVLADLRHSDRYHPERVERLTSHGDIGAARCGVAGEDENDLDVIDLLLWAVAAGVDAADIALLIETECARDRHIPRADDAVASRHCITRRTLYRRRERTLTALRAVAEGYLAAVA